MLLPIQGWDYTVTSCQSDFIPVFYFIPDYEWVSYININGPRNIPIRIQGTGTYDGTYWIKVDRQPETLWHVGFLPINFTGFPAGVGTVELTPVEKPPLPPILQCALNGCC